MVAGAILGGDYHPQPPPPPPPPPTPMDQCPEISLVQPCSFSGKEVKGLVTPLHCMSSAVHADEGRVL